MQKLVVVGDLSRPARVLDEALVLPYDENLAQTASLILSSDVDLLLEFEEFLNLPELARFRLFSDLTLRSLIWRICSAPLVVDALLPNPQGSERNSYRP